LNTLAPSASCRFMTILANGKMPKERAFDNRQTDKAAISES
jgi:hypothetical protein